MADAQGDSAGRGRHLGDCDRGLYLAGRLRQVPDRVRQYQARGREFSGARQAPAALHSGTQHPGHWLGQPSRKQRPRQCRSHHRRALGHRHAVAHRARPPGGRRYQLPPGLDDPDLCLPGGQRGRPRRAAGATRRLGAAQLYLRLRRPGVPVEDPGAAHQHQHPAFHGARFRRVPVGHR